ncbi:unnamed protein product [Urochloa humidicola]
MAAGPEDPEPFSPSDFLNLPPTPPCPDNDDLVLPFITRVLMEEEEEEEDIDNGNPALQEAQQPFADILSDTANTVPVPPFSDAPGFASNAATCWPYDPVELSQVLLLSKGQQHQHGSSSSSQQLLPSADDNRVTMDMLNLAFLKGMEEANKFLPTNNSLLIDIEATSKTLLAVNATHCCWSRVNNNVLRGLPRVNNIIGSQRQG